MIASGADELWVSAAGRIGAACGWALKPLRKAGRARNERHTWLAQGEPGTVVVKALANPFAGQRAEWTLDALSWLAARGYPVPEVLWQGGLDERWFLVVQTWLPGEPFPALDESALNELLALVDLQADHRLGPGGWDVSWWIGAVVFDGWEHWWEGAEAVAAETSERLRRFLRPAWGHRLPTADIVHGDLNLTNVLARDGRITGVVDWDNVGRGSRALDLTSLLFDWHRQRLAGQTALAQDGGERLVRRIIEIAGVAGLRCTVTYGAIARLALGAQRGDRDDCETWRLVVDAILDLASTAECEAR